MSHHKNYVFRYFLFHATLIVWRNVMWRYKLFNNTPQWKEGNKSFFGKKNFEKPNSANSRTLTAKKGGESV